MGGWVGVCGCVRACMRACMHACMLYLGSLLLVIDKISTPAVDQTTRQWWEVKSAQCPIFLRSSTRRQPFPTSGLWSATRQACSERAWRTLER